MSKKQIKKTKKKTTVKKFIGRPKGSKDKVKRQAKAITAKPKPKKLTPEERGWYTLKQAAQEMGLHYATMGRYSAETRPDDVRLHIDHDKNGDRIVTVRELKRFRREIKGKIGKRNF